MEVITGILLLTTLIEGSVAYFCASHARLQPYLAYIALALGVLVSVAYGIDILALFGLKTIVPFLGNVISGIIIGRGSNYLNDLISKLKA